MALYKVGAGNLAIDDVKDFYASIRLNQHKDEEVEIDEVMNVLNS